MSNEVKEFLNSSLLEEYVLGVIDPTHVMEVEHYINTSAEVKTAYEALQEDVERLAKKSATTPPPGLKASILAEIDKSIATENKTPSNNKITNVSQPFKWLALAAGIAAIGLCLCVFNLNSKNDNLKTDLKKAQNDYATLEASCQKQEKVYAQQQRELLFLAEANTAKHVISGNQKATDLKTIAYWNTEKQTAYLRIVSLPELPKDKCFQLWADVDGKMVNLNVIPNQTGSLVSIPFKVAATSLNITMEPAGGSEHPTVSDLVGSVLI